MLCVPKNNPGCLPPSPNSARPSNDSLSRICTLKFLDDFLSEIKKKKYLDNLEIIILSDHGSRIKMNDSESALKNVYFIKSQI